MGLNKKEKYSNQQLQYLSHANFFHAKFVECSNQSSCIVLDELSSYWSVTKTCYNLGFSLVTISKSGFFPRDVLDEILNLIESVSEDFPSYSCISELLCLCCVEFLKKSPRTFI